MENELYQRWDEILEHMKVSFDITDVSYRTFIKILSIYSVEDNKITILIDDINIGNSKSFIEKKYNRFLSVAIEEITGIHYELSYLSLTDLVYFYTLFQSLSTHYCFSHIFSYLQYTFQ